MSHLIAVAQLVDCRCRVSSADDSRSFCLCQSFCYSLGTMCKVRHLEGSHRSVPYNCLCVFHCITEDLLGIRSDIQSFPAFRNLSGLYNLLIGIVGEVVSDHCVNRKQQLNAFFFCLFQHVQCVFTVIFFQKRFSDASALSLAECIRHSAADDQGIYLVQQIFNYRNLTGNLCSAQDGNERSLRVVDSISKEIDLFLHQISDYRGIHELGHTHIGAVCTVCGSECIIYKYVTQRSQLFAESLAVFCLLCSVTGIFKKDHITVLHSLNSCLCVRSYYLRISRKFHFLSQKL